MMFSVSIYSFSGAIRDGRLTPLACIAKAKEMGFDAIEWVDFIGENGAVTKEFAEKIRLESERVGIPVSNFAVGADFVNGSDGDLQTEIAKVKEKVDLAQIMGTPFLRHDITGGPQTGTYMGYENILPRVTEAVRDIAAYAAGKNIRTMTENHGIFSQDSLRVEKLVNTVAHPNFGLLCDIGNFTCADEDPAVAVGRVARYAFYAHAKDFHIKSGNGVNPGEGFFQSRNGNFLRGAIIGHGDVPVLHCLRALKRAGFDGYLAIEFEGMEDCLKGITIGLENLKRFWSMV